MTKTLDFYFDFGSPTAYLAHKRLQQLREKFDLNIVYKPILLGGIFKATGNMSPIAIPAKGAYMNQYDLPRFAKRYQVSLVFNPFFPINTLPLMRGAIAAQKMHCFDSYLNVTYDAVWVEQKNMGELETIAETLAAAGIDAPKLLQLCQDPSVKAELISSTEAAVELGAFGAPTMFMEGEMFFGQDRLDFIAEALAAISPPSSPSPMARVNSARNTATTT